MDPVVLSFYDSLLRESDVALLEGSNWLNDRVIGFYFEYLEYNVFREFSGAVCFVTPDVTQFIKLCKDPAELGLFLDPLNLHQRELIVLAINNCQDSSQAGGSHWSILTYNRKENSFCHLDSMSPSNTPAAMQCAQNISPYLKAPEPLSFEDLANCPRQENFHDCGVYALLFTEALCRVKLQGAPVSTLTGLNTDAAQQWRADTKQLVYSLAAKSKAE